MQQINRREALKRAAILLGGAVSAPTIAGLLSGCQPRASYGPQTLSDDQDALVTAIAEHIIPATDTPGARAAQVNQFIDLMLTDNYPEDARSRFLAGLEDVDERCRQAYGGAFLRCSPDEQRAVLTELDEQAFGQNAAFDPANPAFFRMMKELTLVGYYTSEIGASQELQINLTPGRYDGCAPLEEVGRAWAT